MSFLLGASGTGLGVLAVRKEFHAVGFQMKTQFLGNLLLELFQRIVTKFNNAAALIADQVVVMFAIGANKFKSAALFGERMFEQKSGRRHELKCAINSCKADAAVQLTGLAGDGLCIDMGPDLQNGLHDQPTLFCLPQSEAVQVGIKCRVNFCMVGSLIVFVGHCHSVNRISEHSFLKGIRHKCSGANFEWQSASFPN